MLQPFSPTSPPSSLPPPPSPSTLSSVLPPTPPPTPPTPIRLFNLMRCSAVPPDLYTFPLLLKACNLLPLPPNSPPIRYLGAAVHALVLRLGLASDIYVANTLVRLYGVIALPDAALQAFAEMPVKDTVSWSATISALVNAGRHADALVVFHLMQSSAPYMLPDKVTVIGVVSAVAGIGALDLAVWIHCYVLRFRLPFTVKLGTALISMYACCGSMDRAAAVFDEMPERNARTWTAIINGYAAHGCSSEALQSFDAMLEAGLYPDHVTMIGVLTACSHGGLVDEGWRVFETIERILGKGPRIKHYGCMVDLMGRAGLLNEAHEIINRMPMGPTIVIWRTLLGACSSHGDAVLAEYARRRIMELEPQGQQHDGDYILLANTYVGVGRWEEKDRVRCMMRDQGVAKRPGCSLLESLS